MRLPASLIVVVLLVPALRAVGQDRPEIQQPLPEHAWLQQFVGEWETETEVGGPEKPPTKCKGGFKGRMVGGLWVVSELTLDMMGTPMVAVQTIGYDAKTKKYIGSWIDSTFSRIWNYEGSLDPTGKILTVEADGPNFAEAGQVARFGDTYEFKSKDHIVQSSAMQTPEGKWVTFMIGNSRRKK